MTTVLERMRKATAAILLFLTPSLAFGNIVWPALYTETKVSSLPIIALSLLLEFLVIRALFNKSIKISASFVVAANLLSGLVGLFLRPLSGIAWELSLGQLVKWIFDWGTFNPLAWVFVPIIGGAINAAIELLTIKLIWKEKFTKKNYLILWAINWVTVGIATIWVILSPPAL